MESDLDRLCSHKTSIKTKHQIVTENYNIELSCFFLLPKCLGISPNGSHLITGHQEGSIKKWDLLNPLDGKLMGAHDGAVITLIISSKDFVVTSGHDKKVVVRHFLDNKILAVYNFLAYCLALNQDSSEIIAGGVDDGNDGIIAVFDVKTKDIKKKIKAYEKGILSICAMRNCNFFISGSEENLIKIWDLASMNLVTSIEHRHGYISSICDNNDYIFTASWDKTISVIDKTGYFIKEFLNGHSGDVVALAISSEYLFSLSIDKSVKLWDLNSLSVVDTVMFESTMKSFVYGNNSLYFTGIGRYIRRWDVDTRKFAEIITPHLGGVIKISLTDDRKLILTSGRDKTVRVWDIEKKKQVKIFIGHTDLVRFIQMTQDRRILVTLGDDKCLKLWDVDSETIFHSQFIGKPMKDLSNSLFLQGKYIIALVEPYTYKIFFITSGQEISTIHRKRFLLSDFTRKIRLR